jgi:hypothetical protein
VASVVYPKYETRGELAQSTAAFLEWYIIPNLSLHCRESASNAQARLKERVMELRKTHLDNPWPPNDRNVGVVLVAHSMG